VIDVDEQRIARLEAKLVELTAAVAERDRVIAERDATIAKLEARVRELEEQLGRNSSNSGKPPSSDSPTQRKNRRTNGRKRSGRKRGGQPGHQGHTRALVPPDKVTVVVTCAPTACGACDHPLPEPNSNAPVRRHQVFELPRIEPEVTEYQLVRMACPSCAAVTEGALPDDAPPGAFGPRLTALVALMSGMYRLSKRSIVSLLSDVLGVRMSLGSVSTAERRVSLAIEGAATEAVNHVREQEVRYVDASSWYQAAERENLWVVATSVLSVFLITARATAETVRRIMGGVRGKLVCDRATSFKDWPADMRQTCWAHLRRYFIQYAARGGKSKGIGEELLDLTRVIFVALHRIRDGDISRDYFLENMRPIKARFRELLEEGSVCDVPKTSRSCDNILKHHWDAMWTFLEHDDVDPTNNHAERELRHSVIWRRTSYGTQSEAGDRFVERILTVVQSMKKQGRHVLTFLEESCRAKWDGKPGPSLLPDPPP
jgi:transposase